MPELVADCPRCDAKKHTFSVNSIHFLRQQFGWQSVYEAYSICKNCDRGTTFIIESSDSRTAEQYRTPSQLMSYINSLNNLTTVTDFVRLQNSVAKKAPPHVPETVEKIFKEGSESLSGNCPNAAGAMFRLCIDLITKEILQHYKEEEISRPVQKILYQRLKWLFEKNKLPNDLKDLSHCIRQDGNDSAHEGSLTLVEAEDLCEFTYILLERVYTQPEKIKIATQRRETRRQKASQTPLRRPNHLFDLIHQVGGVDGFHDVVTRA